MPIVSSVVVSDAVQFDGRRRVTELHADNLGVTYGYTYLCAAGFDAAAALASRATQLPLNIAAAEIYKNVLSITTLGSLAAPALQWSTATQNIAALRTTYAVATQMDAIMIGDYLSSLTDGQLQTAFGLTAPQVTSLRSSKLTPAAAAAATIRASTGT